MDLVQYSNHKEISIHPMLLKKIGKGTQGNVYHWNNQALKIWHSKDYPPSLEEHKYLAEFSDQTPRFLLPNDLFLDKDHHFRGEISRYISTNKNQSIYDMKKKDFIEELNAAKEELLFLANKQIAVFDLRIYNMKYDGMLHFVDSGMYSRRKFQSPSSIYQWNIKHFNRFLIDLFTKELLSIKSDDDIDEFNKNKPEYPNGYDIGEYMKKTMSDDDTLSSYVKKYCKKNK